jgi:hypothetical protein
VVVGVIPTQRKFIVQVAGTTCIIILALRSNGQYNYSRSTVLAHTPYLLTANSNGVNSDVVDDTKEQFRNLTHVSVHSTQFYYKVSTCSGTFSTNSRCPPVMECSRFYKYVVHRTRTRYLSYSLPGLLSTTRTVLRKLFIPRLAKTTFLKSQRSGFCLFDQKTPKTTGFLVWFSVYTVLHLLSYSYVYSYRICILYTITLRGGVDPD